MYNQPILRINRIYTITIIISNVCNMKTIINNCRINTYAFNLGFFSIFNLIIIVSKLIDRSTYAYSLKMVYKVIVKFMLYICYIFFE